ncbi:TPA: ATP-binding protein [Escherichia coli]|uniref:ATP-binding protein n=1 Tax=Escherichia coli TaxID=562 RepID=UPI0006A02A6C|nr:ATP-binding protein [Escherichia coli]EFH2872198.1 ATP-binding protein [Escherichia coli]EFH7367319.1 ATP-binding protein [Escherichia coli]EGI7150975.1 ATP-binding protein [Escherichia coli]EHW7469800.1 ATP-binding protein [Escherichia coli]EHX8040571.1 ATP-binding protein [Escherichia coli]
MNAAAVRQMVVTALTGATDAGSSVYSPRDWSTSADMYPALLVQTPFEQKKSLGRNTPAFTTITTVRITGRVQEYDGDTTDDGAMKAELALEALRDQVERAVINSYELTRKIQKYAEVRSTINVDADGEAHMGQLLLEIDIEHYQGPEDFYPVQAVPLEGIDIAIVVPDGTPQPGISLNFQE